MRSLRGGKEVIAAVVEVRSGWAKLWIALWTWGDGGECLRMLPCLMIHHGKGVHPCPSCDVTNLEVIPYKHVLCSHRRGLRLAATIDHKTGGCFGGAAWMS